MGQYFWGNTESICGLEIIVILAFLNGSGKWWRYSEVCANPFLGICFSVFNFIVYVPSAFPLWNLFCVFLIWSGLVIMECEGGTARKYLSSFLVLLWMRSYVHSFVRDRKFELCVSANFSALCSASKARLPPPLSRWFRDVCFLVKWCMFVHCFPFSTSDFRSLLISFRF